MSLFKLLCLMLLAALPVIAITPTSFTFQFYDANGQPDTNLATTTATNILTYQHQ